MFRRKHAGSGERTEKDQLRCSFCNKSQDAVAKLIAGPTVFICNECVDVCNDIIAGDPELTPPAPEPESVNSASVPVMRS